MKLVHHSAYCGSGNGVCQYFIVFIYLLFCTDLVKIMGNVGGVPHNSHQPKLLIISFFFSYFFCPLLRTSSIRLEVKGAA